MSAVSWLAARVGLVAGSAEAAGADVLTALTWWLALAVAGCAGAAVLLRARSR